MQRYIVRSSTSYVPRLTRAFAQKAQSEIKGDEKFNVAPAFPDDFEDSPLKSEILEKRNREQGIKDADHPNIYEIYESIQGKPPQPFKSAKKTDKPAPKKPDPAGEEREPEIDEM
ncbi:hypothetical protein N7517_001523 [Penicillium concentricum]|uniref:Uncharacterized protein n=1 Tax=Penicillium concentricum TaxID=293559 RepID=A0A9W9SS66_9EURO|nr:uncharacterized protein N7517_001523 [Penicillium concentricum]KAJ5383612.1 hypothetical protein N7517_001523 [Penicillium concentricum]